MLKPPTRRLSSLRTPLAISVLLVTCFMGEVSGQASKLRSLKPTDIVFHTFDYEKEGRKLRREQKYDEALEQYGKANELFNTIKINYPAWNTNVVERGFERIRKQVKETLEERAEAEKKNGGTSLYPAEGGDENSLSARAKRRAESVLDNDKNLKKLSSTLSTLNQRISEKEQELKNHERRESSKTELLKELKERDAKLEALKSASSEKEQQAKVKQSLLTDEVLALRTQLKESKNLKAEEASLQQRNLAQEIAQKDKEILELKENTVELREENKAHQSSLYRQISDLNKKLTALSADSPATQRLSEKSEQQQQELTTLKQKLTQVQTEQTTLIKEKHSFQKDAENMRRLLEKREKEKKQLSQLLSKKEKAYESTLSSLEGKIKLLEGKPNPLPSTALINEAGSLKKEIKTATSAAEIAKKKAQDLIQENQLNAVEALEEITQKETELKDAKELVEQAKEETNETKAALSQKTNSLNNAEAELKKLRDLQKATLAEKAALLSETEKQQAIKEKEILTLKEDLTKAEQEAQKTSEKEVSLLKNISLLSDTLKKSQQDQENTLLSLRQITTDNTAMMEELTSLKEERNILLARPLRSEVETLKSDLRSSITEKETLAKNLSENEGKYYEAIDRIEKLQNELETTRSATSKLEENIKEERDIANDVIKSQRERLSSQNNDLISLKRKLATEEAKASKLQRLVDQTKDQYGEIQDKYEGLLVEHDQLKLLLNEDKSEDQLKEENATLKRKLTIARTQFEKALNTKETSKEDLLIARKEYAIMRTELYKTKHKLELANLRGDKLVKKLQETEAELKIVEAANDSQYTVEEVTMLKELLTKHQDMQTNRKRARSLILEEVKRLGGDDTQILAALDLAETQELILSDDQKQLLANPNADSEFRFSDQASPEERKRAEAALNQRLSVHDKLGRSAYKKGHYLAAEEFFQINLEDHPGHIPSMLNLGVSRLRRAEKNGASEDYILATTSFEDALAMRGDSGLPYALLMLGYAHYKQGKDQKAVEYFLQCLEADPNNAKAHVYLGSLMAEQGDLKASANHLEKALETDPTLTEPQYNLALLLESQGKYNEALKNYRQALSKGAPSDPGLEDALRKALPEANFN